MAAKPDPLVQVTVNFEGNRTVLHLPKNMKIGLAIQKAAEQFKQDPRGLTFLYHGLEITDDMTVGVRASCLVNSAAPLAATWDKSSNLALPSILKAR